MEPQDLSSTAQRTPGSSTSAVHVSGSPASGIDNAQPSLGPSDSRGSIARRRTSWSQRLYEVGQDPLWLDSSELQPKGRTPAPVQDLGLRSSLSNLDDPFSRNHDSFPSHLQAHDIAMPSTSYANHQVEPSLDALAPEIDSDEGYREDDEAHLTANMSHNVHQGEYDAGDPENAASMSPRTRRRIARYGVSSSPLKKTGSVIKSMSHNLRRASVRVVNIASTGLESKIRLSDDDMLPSQESGGLEVDEWQRVQDLKAALPIRGRTLGFLSTKSRLRLALFNFLVYPWTEPVILVLIIVNAVVLTLQASSASNLPSGDNSSPPHIKGYFQTWEDYVLFVFFIIFTLEAVARICVSGLIFDPDMSLSSLFPSRLGGHSDIYPSTPTASLGDSVHRTNSTARASIRRGTTITSRIRSFKTFLSRPFILNSSSSSGPQSIYGGPTAPSEIALTTSYPPRQSNVIHNSTSGPDSRPTYLSQALRSDNSQALVLPFRLNIQHIHAKSRRNIPYLRSSWTRIDFIAIVSFWIAFALATAGVERGQLHIGIFRALSVLRTARLLTITSGTTTIMHSLKIARPLLTQVAYFVIFAFVLFSIIGIQSFGGSLRRTCVLSPTLGENAISTGQFCGGHINSSTLVTEGYLMRDGQFSATSKGYICPLGQLCEEQDNPKEGVQSFDSIGSAILQIIVIASANTWSPLMYSIIDAEFWVSCFFFIIGIIVLNFWLINLFVAVITNTFSAIRAQTRRSAFGAKPLVMIQDEDENWTGVDGRAPRPNIAKTIYGYTKWFWVLLALVSLSLQATRTVNITQDHEYIMYYGELTITLAFDIEIILRMAAALPDWRTFFYHGNNLLDLILALGSSIIQLPMIHDSVVYPWFTIFQLARFYRVILVIPRMKPLLLRVFGNMYALANMLLFLLLMNYIAALMATQLLRGDASADNAINFGDIWNSYLSVYQVFSSENWTDVLYAATGAETQLGQTFIVGVFITSWLLFANFLLLQMFIAVINENFEVAEESKKAKQASNYLASHQVQTRSRAWLRRLNPYRWVKADPVKVKVDDLPENLVLPIQKSIIQDHSIPRFENRSPSMSTGQSRTRHYHSTSLNALDRLFGGERMNDYPLATLRRTRNNNGPSNEVERYLELLSSLTPEATASREVVDVMHEFRAQKADFIRNHPTYDKPFWILSQKNRLRILCQKLVQPPNGERIYGHASSPIAHPIFQLVLLFTVIGGIVVESIATPVYRRNHFSKHGTKQGAWFDVAESAFGFTLVLEFLIKIIADGFVFTPNAYLRSIWNVLDFVIMIGILVNVVTGLIFVGGLSRFTRALKALRALRLITLIDKMRNTFQSLILSGVSRILDAAILAFLYMVPYAVWGLNIFSGKMKQCNDKDVSGMASCVGEFPNTVLPDSFGFLVPRTWDNPSPSTTFSFDTFRSSLLILFEIVSLEGWIDVMAFANSITGSGKQPSTNASQWNALFFMIYNIMGGVVILTLFVSIIIGNFKSKTGSAFLTAAQREWIDLQKLFKRQKPSKRPKRRPVNSVRAWCFDRAVYKRGWWSRMLTLVFILQIVALMSQRFTSAELANTIRNDIFLVIISIYLIDVAIRLFGLGWSSYQANGWNLFDLVVASGSFLTTLAVRYGSAGYAVEQLQKLFLVSIAFKLVQRFNALNMLFKTAVASLPVILSLLGLWLILFVFFAIMYVEIFGLTKWGKSETRNQNYSSLGSALVMLAFMSVGEGWNQYMHDYELTYPRCTNPSRNQPDSDCGSEIWSLSLAIAWNLLSMYIFVNMFTGVVVENFSYVFQTSSGGAKSVTREQMRSFKKTWAEFANPKTGYLERPRFVPFFQKLSGAFEVRIYPVEFSIPNILASCRQPSIPGRLPNDVDFGKLNAVLNDIDFSKIRKHKATFNRLYHEAMLSHGEYGISFNDMLILLAHHKFIVDAEALILKDLVSRTEINKLVTDLVNFDRVRSLLQTITTRRRYLAERERRLSRQQDIPAIVIDPTVETIPSLVATPDGSPFNSPHGSPRVSWSERRFHASDVSLALDLTAGLQRSSRRASDNIVVSVGSDFTSRQTSMAEADVLSSMQSSMWSNLMSEAADEEDKM